MPDSLLQNMLHGGARGRWVRLRTLTLLRWLAIVGQAGAVAAAVLIFEMRLPVELCAFAIAASVVLNVVSMQIYPANARLNDKSALISMLFDLAQVSFLLFITGGLTNPFAALLLAPVVMSASVLVLGSALVVGGCALASVALMALWHQPIFFENGDVLAPPPIYILGVWASLTIAILFMAIYARRVSIEHYHMTVALSAAQRALSSEQRLTAIGGLAAAAAHELGTPLATIKLVSSELEDELKDYPDLREDAELISKQADRCRDILADLSQGGRSDEHYKLAPITALIEEAAEPHRDRGRQIVLRLEGAQFGAYPAAPPVVKRSPEIVHGLRNLIQNAIDFAETTIWVDVNSSETTLRIRVGDDGPGYPDGVMQHLGDPYITSRARKVDTSRDDSVYSGMGLGLFIAKTLLERTGAEVSFANTDRSIRRANRGVPMEERRPPGALVAVTWASEGFVAPQGEGREALGENQRFTFDDV